MAYGYETLDSKSPKVTIISPQGEMDFSWNTKGLKAEFNRTWVGRLRRGTKTFILNLSETTYIDVIALAAILQAEKSIKEKGGRLLICGLQGQPKEMFRLGVRDIENKLVFKDLGSAMKLLQET